MRKRLSRVVPIVIIVLAGPVIRWMQAALPERAVGDIVNDVVDGDVGAPAILTVMAAQLFAGHGVLRSGNVRARERHPFYLVAANMPPPPAPVQPGKPGIS